MNLYCDISCKYLLSNDIVNSNNKMWQNHLIESGTNALDLHLYFY